MALRVVTNYQPKVNLKVTKAPTYTGKLRVTTAPVRTVTPKTYNPQKSVSVAPKTYNPQKTATPKQIQNATVSPDWAKQQAAKLRAETDRIEAAKQAQKKRLADAKNIELQGHQGSFASTLKDKVTFGADRRARSGREAAVQYYNENERVWGGNILARQRNYEVKAGELKNWVIQATTEDDYNKRVAEAMKWLDGEYKVIDDDIKDYRLTQIELSNYAQTPLTSKVAGGARFSKDFFGGIAGQSWNTLSKIAETPERLINTTRNFIDPNNQRKYYGGDEKKNAGDIIGQGSNPFNTAINQLRKSYNASEDQRILGLTKDEEARRLAGGQVQARNKDTGELETFTRKPATGFNEWQIKYGDDIANLIADPLNFLPNQWAAKALKGTKGSKAGQQVSKFVANRSDDFFKWAGNNEKATNFLISREARKANPNTFGKWLNRKVGTTKNDFFSDNKKLIETKQGLQEELSTAVNEWRNVKNETWGTVKGRLKGLDDNEARILQEFILPQTFANQARDKVSKAIYSWDDVEVPRGFNKAKRRDIEDLARDLKKRTDDLRLFGIDVAEQQGNFDRAAQIRKANNRSYIPFYSGSNGSKGKLDTSVKQADWFLKAKTGIGKQSKDQLVQSYQKRFISQLYSDTDAGRWLGQNANDYKDRITDAQKTLGWREQAYKPNAFNKINEASLKNKLSPTKFWKKAVLAANPAWYANNIATNIPFSISAGGAGTIPEYFKMLKKKGRDFSGLPEGVTGNIDDFVGGGKLGQLGSKVENTSRVAAYRALKKRGFTDEKAIKEVNRWLFDYSVKNYERPAKAIAPFYKWQTNLMRLSAQMPFTNPRSANAYSEFQKQFFDRPLDQLPEGEQEYVDPDTGQTRKYNPRAAYEGKMFVGNDDQGNPKFANTPFWALNPNTMTDFGLNPLVSLGQDLATSTNRFGQRNTDSSAWQLGLDKFPQGSLARKYAARNDKDSKFWFADSGNSKWKQGFDTEAPNYDRGLDNKRKLDRGVNSFFGIPNTVTFDKKEYDTKQRLTKFNEEFFNVDWDEIANKDYAEANRQKEALAKKHGFDLQKDIYDNYWSKYDTPNTKKYKEQKTEAFKFNTDFWEGYNALPKGSKTSQSKRRPYVIDKFNQWREDETFLKNGFFNLPAFNEYDDDGNKTGEKNYINPRKAEVEQAQSDQRIARYQERKAKGSPHKYDGKFFKSAQSRDKYKDFQEREKFQYDGKFFKSAETREKYIDGEFWKKYYETDDYDERQKLLDQNPKYRTFDTPTTQAEWNELKSRIKSDRNAKLDKMSDFTLSREEIKKQIERGTPKGFGGSRRLRYKF